MDPHEWTDVVFGTAAGRLVYDSDAFDEVDQRLVDAFEGG